MGMKCCFNNTRGCRTRLAADHPRSKCEDCLAVDREKYRASLK
jgi:hypothetical protein